jgi:hypothetical protein
MAVTMAGRLRSHPRVHHEEDTFSTEDSLDQVVRGVRLGVWSGPLPMLLGSNPIRVGPV